MPALWMLLEHGWRWWWQLQLQDMQSSSQSITINEPTPNFLQARCPSCCPTNSGTALKAESITVHRLAHPKLTWGLPSLFWPLKALSYLGDGWQASCQPSDTSTPMRINITKFAKITQYKMLLVPGRVSGFDAAQVFSWSPPAAGLVSGL